MKLSLSPADRIGPTGPSVGGRGSVLPMLVYGLVVPVTLAALAAAGWYIVTGETPTDLMADLFAAPRIEMDMPTRPESAGQSVAPLIQPPSGSHDAKMTMEPVPAPGAEAPPPPPPPAAAPAPKETPPVAKTPVAPPPPPAKPQASADGLPTVSLPSVPADTAGVPAAPAISEPAIPSAGEPLAPPTFSQLPARADLKALGAAPANDLLRNSPNGPLPVASNGREARTVYARPFNDAVKLPKIAVVVTGLGLSRDGTEAAITKLPPDVSLSFSPYAASLDNWVKRARASGHEVLLDLPLEPPNYPLHDAGPMAVLSRHTPAEAVAHLDAILAKTTSYVGVAAQLRSPVAAKDPWIPVLQDIKNRGLLFVGDGLVGVPDAQTPASRSVDTVADETPFRASIDARLAKVLQTTQRDGASVIYVQARPVTLERLLAWFESFPQKNAVLAPVSAVVRTSR